MSKRVLTKKIFVLISHSSLAVTSLSQQVHPVYVNIDVHPKTVSVWFSLDFKNDYRNIDDVTVDIKYSCVI